VGAAKSVAGHVQQHQKRRFGRHEEPGEQEPQQEPADPQPAPPPAAPAVDPIQRLKDLADLKSQGIITDDEFAAQKARILAA
jgi:hypothetical protein